MIKNQTELAEAKEPMTNNQNTNRVGQRKKLLRFIDGRSAGELD
jgi:hypothetical protein